MLMLKADDEVVSISDDDHVARDLAMSPSVGPEVEYVVRALARSISRLRKRKPANLEAA
jgi:hypothetical protein